MILSDMAKHDPDLSLLFHALSDPTRRMMLSRLAKGPAAVTELADPTGLRLPTIMRHLSVLEEAGLSLSGGGVSDQSPQSAWADSQRDAETSSRPSGLAGGERSAGMNPGDEGPAMRPAALRSSRPGGLDLYA